MYRIYIYKLVRIFIYTRTMWARVTIKTWKIGRRQRLGEITRQTFSSLSFALVYLLLKFTYIFETCENSRACKFYRFEKQTFQDTRRFLRRRSDFEEEKRFVSVSIAKVSGFSDNRAALPVQRKVSVRKSRFVHSIIAPTWRQSLNFVKILHFAFCRTGTTTGGRAP